MPAPPPIAPSPAASAPDDLFPTTDAERAVLRALRDIAYGQVEVVVHASRIVQITRSLKLRLDTPA